ncbi:MAG: trehalose-phosphatase [Chloroflexota bacterium]|nr:MAG: trehalose-phosphatase [Chloroflexota bacterium]
MSFDEGLESQIARSEKLWLFLDYDGTLAGFAPTPDDILIDQELIDLLSRLVSSPRLRLAVVSGRRLSHVRELLPVPGLFLAGAYGIEIQLPNGEQIQRMDLASIRPVLESIKPGWQKLIAGRQGFYLEDKGWSLALHARFATDEDAGRVLSAARSLAEEHLRLGAAMEIMHLLGGHKFLEVSPRAADKGHAVEFLLERFPFPGALSVMVGDDDKDELAFERINAYGGISIVVSPVPRPSHAHFRLASPLKVRRCLESIIHLNNEGPAF